MFEILAHEHSHPVQYVCNNGPVYFLSDVDKNNARFKTFEGASYVKDLLKEKMPFKRFEVIKQ